MRYYCPRCDNPMTDKGMFGIKECEKCGFARGSDPHPDMQVVWWTWIGQCTSQVIPEWWLVCGEKERA